MTVPARVGDRFLGMIVGGCLVGAFVVVAIGMKVAGDHRRRKRRMEEEESRELGGGADKRVDVATQEASRGLAGGRDNADVGGGVRNTVEVGWGAVEAALLGGREEAGLGAEGVQRGDARRGGEQAQARGAGGGLPPLSPSRKGGGGGLPPKFPKRTDEGVAGGGAEERRGTNV